MSGVVTWQKTWRLVFVCKPAAMFHLQLEVRGLSEPLISPVVSGSSSNELREAPGVP